MIGPFLPTPTETIFQISTASAQILANEFNKKDWIDLLPIILTTGTAFGSAIAAYKSWKIAENSLKVQQDSLIVSKNSTQIAHDLFINELDKIYFDIRQNSPIVTSQFTDKQKSIMCNFLEKICSHYFQNKISEQELLMFQSDLENKDFIEFSKKLSALGEYKKWLLAKKLI